MRDREWSPYRSPPCHLFWSSTLKPLFHKNNGKSGVVIGSRGSVNPCDMAILVVLKLKLLPVHRHSLVS